MSEGDDLERRVSALEDEVGGLRGSVERSREDASAARVLASHADRDVGEIRAEIREFHTANNRTLNAMRDDLADQRALMDRRFDQVDQRFDEVNPRFDAVDQRFDEVNQRFDGVDRRFEGVDQSFAQVNRNLASSHEQIMARLQTLIDRAG